MSAKNRPDFTAAQQLGYLVVDLRLTGRAVDLYKGVLQDCNHTQMWAFLVVERDRAGTVLWAAGLPCLFERDAASWTLAKVRERFRDSRVGG